MEKNLIRRLFEASDMTKMQFSKSELSQLSKLISGSTQIAITQLIEKYDFSRLISEVVNSSLKNIDFSNFAKAIATSIPKIDFTPIFLSQIPEMHSIGRLIAENHLSALSQIRANAFLSSAFLEQIKEISTLQQTFAVQLTESLFKAVKIDDADEQDNNGNLKAVVERVIQSQPDTKSKFQILIFIITIMGTIFAGGQFYYAHLQSASSKQESADNDRKFLQILEVLQKIAGEIDSSTDNEEVYYIVERQVKVKIKPNFKSATIVVLYPNQKVSLIKSEHKWIYIEYFDYIDGVRKLGWVSKKYLVKMK